MKLLDILPKKSIIPDLKGRTKKQVLEELIDALLQEKPELDRERLMAVLLERERLGSTGIGDGIAIPHGKLKDLDQLILAFGKSSGRCGFRIDGRQTGASFFPPGGSGELHRDSPESPCKDRQAAQECSRA